MQRGRAWTLLVPEQAPAAVREDASIQPNDEVLGDPLANQAPAATRSWTVASTLVDCGSIRVESHEPRFLTFVDPTPETGLFPFARIAGELSRRRPDFPILIVDCNGTAAELLSCGVDFAAHANIRVMRHDGDAAPALAQ